MLTAIASLAALYALICVGAFLGQRGLIYFPPRPPSDAAAARAGIERLPDEPALEVLHLPAPPDAPTVVHFHGNAEQLWDQRHLGEALRTRGLGFFAIEYPGYGRSAGSPSEEAIYAAAERGLAELRRRGVDADRIVLSGQSLGSGVAVELAARGHGARVVLLSAYTSLVDVAQRAYPFLPAGLLLRDRFESEAKVASLAQPLLLVHGADDRLIPTRMSRRLAAAARDAQLVVVAGAGHNDLWPEGGVALLDRIAAFARGDAAPVP